jgi:bifunctional pyridoxal-dependent enzyme with beta-cystathionase and maltose regulon repressor activities
LEEPRREAKLAIQQGKAFGSQLQSFRALVAACKEKQMIFVDTAPNAKA